MFVYNTEVVISDTSYSNENLYIVQTDTSPSLNDYVNYFTFHNNQGRELELSSPESFNTDKKTNKLMFQVKDIVDFFWDFNNNVISYRLLKNGTRKLLEYWLYHIVLPIYFTLKEKYLFLHVGAVSVEHNPVIFMANSFGGKSTLTDFFLKKGHALITDDKLATYKENEEFFAVASHPYHRPYREQETLGIKASNIENKPNIFKTIYVLQKASKDSTIQFNKLHGIKKFKHLHSACEMEFPFTFQKNTEYLLELSKKVQLFTIEIPWDLNRLEEVYNKIIEHQKNLELGT